MTRKTCSLNDSNWRVGSVAQKNFGDVNDLADVRDWLPAQIPGDVRLDLLRAGKIADPFYADNNKASQWIDARDWWYVRDLNLELEKNERAFLVFDGIDYLSAVYLNDKLLDHHEGMFSRQLYELDSSLVTRHSSLAIRIWGADALPKLSLTPIQKIWARLIQPLFRPPEHAFPDRYATLKCQMQFGWDFAPRLRTCGIWDDASVVVARSVFIADAWIKSKVISHKSQVAKVSVTLMLDSDREQNVHVICNVRGKNFVDEPQTFTFDLNLARGEQVRDISFDLIGARMWNPWDRGEPNLYEIEVVILSGTERSGVESKDPILDSLTETFGIRSFELARAPASEEPWQFVINGSREFLRGANWVPLDAIPGRLTRDDYAIRLHQARNANINFLRVWGGGMREKRAFYDLCDELGILVWQEFPFGGTVLDSFPTQRDHLQLIRDECSDIVRTLRNHPSLVVWCGGNEFSPSGNQTIVKKLRAVVKDKDGTRPFKPASPYRDESHNWRVWHRFANLRDYREDRTPFLSEFGLQALPNFESLKKFLPDEALNAPHKLWEYHHADVKKLGRYAHPVILSEAKNLHPEHSETLRSTQGDRVDKFISATQRSQAIGLQIAIEHMRRRKPEATGVAIWQLNDCWPAVSWSVIDYYGTPKRAYADLQRLYTPVFASFDYPLILRRAGNTVRGNLWLINDLLDAFENVELRAELNGDMIYTQRASAKPDSATKIDSLTVTLGDDENILRLIVRDNSHILSDHEYDLNFCDVGEIDLLNWLMVQVGKRLTR
ncbi:MAG: hypothetical protein HZB51_20425 [Chloroflexi bacterium]|nr:hypothetical protein [Chloroflexota bacterium]